MPIKKYFFVFLLSLVLIAASSLIISTTSKVDAGMDTGSGANKNDIGGHAWSDNIGWISFSCNDKKTCGIPPSGVQYGVDMEIDGGNKGALSGYAWSDNIGWISFETSDVSGCPQTELTNKSCPPKVNFSDGISSARPVSGWARACAGTEKPDCTGPSRTDGWDGWISLKGSKYAVTYNETLNPTQFKGFAWGSDVVGWVSFNKVDTGSEVPYKVYGPAGTEVPPNAPEPISAVAGCTEDGKPKITYSYLPPTDGTPPFEYIIDRKAPGDGYVEVEDDFTEVVYTDLNVVGGGSYSYKVKAKNDVGTSGFSGVESATAPTDCVATKEVEMEFTATPNKGVLNYQCNLNWKVSSFNAGSTSCTLKGPGINKPFIPSITNKGEGFIKSPQITSKSKFTFSCFEADDLVVPVNFIDRSCEVVSGFVEGGGDDF